MGSHEKDPSSPKRALSRSNSTVSSKHSSVQQGSESWEVVEEPRARGSPRQQPQRHEGYLLKKRKWPLKGWHKRYFVLENGILKYSTTRQDVLKGKLHGAIDVRQSVMSVNKKAQRVDLDTEDNIYHLKIKSPELFSSWVSSLCTHHHGERPEPCPPGGPTGTTTQGQWTRILPSGSAPALSTLASSRDKVNAWLKDSEGLERCSAELSECQAKLQELTGMLQHLEALHRIPSAPLISGSQVRGTARPKKGRRTTKIWCTQSFAKDDTIGRVGRLHGSVPNLSRYLESSQSQLPFSLPPEYSQLQRSFWVLAQKVHGSLSSVVAALMAERARLEEMRQALDRQCPAPRPGSAGTAGPALRRFHSLSVSSDTTLDSFASLHPDEPDSLPAKGREQQLSNRSIVSLADSHTEFFDACEVFLSASSSENEGECEDLGDMREPKDVWGQGEFEDLGDMGEPEVMGRPGEFKDLGVMEESLRILVFEGAFEDFGVMESPRSCRDRENLRILGSWGAQDHGVYVAAFAVSAYASTYYRAGSKPFNPVLGETYECVRPDRGFRFISEQVSHHPPISACHAESDNFVFWQ
ncbi:OSBL7 protein, partial [Certhia brachydactyla]|nr:OSBL7 protein [Certhia brachydactyla]